MFVLKFGLTAIDIVGLIYLIWVNVQLLFLLFASKNCRRFGALLDCSAFLMCLDS